MCYTENRDNAARKDTETVTHYTAIPAWAYISHFAVDILQKLITATMILQKIDLFMGVNNYEREN